MGVPIKILVQQHLFFVQKQAMKLNRKRDLLLGDQSLFSANLFVSFPRKFFEERSGSVVCQSCEEVRTSQKLNLVVLVEKCLRTTGLDGLINGI